MITGNNYRRWRTENGHALPDIWWTEIEREERGGGYVCMYLLETRSFAVKQNGDSVRSANEIISVRLLRCEMNNN